MTATIPTTATEFGTYFYWNPTGTAGTNDYVEITGVQLEVGSVATAFKTSSATIQGELAACQRYYWRTTSDGTTATTIGGVGIAATTTTIKTPLKCPTTMRVKPTSLDFSNLAILDVAASRTNVTAVVLDDPSTEIAGVILTSSGLTIQRSYLLYNQSAATGYVGFSAEL